VRSATRHAVECVQEIQSRLAPMPIRVRIGIHSGEALVADDHYVGIDVHRAARIGACGHGGQVVLSPTTVTLLEPGSFVLRDLGNHRLKDLSAPVRLHQEGNLPAALEHARAMLDPMQQPFRPISTSRCAKVLRAAMRPCSRGRSSLRDRLATSDRTRRGCQPARSTPSG
jgi:hypothetical protein